MIAEDTGHEQISGATTLYDIKIKVSTLLEPVTESFFVDASVSHKKI